MPTTYTHDLFGREVYKQLPKHIKKVIRSSKSMYLTGLQGPDILFYYHPLMKNKINSLGNTIHEHEAAAFFCQAIIKYQEEPSPQLLSYLLGFGCHYILDSACHSYIREYEELTGVSHEEIETELDRYYMRREGKNPFLYRPAVSICITPGGCGIISRAFGKITEKQVRKALKSMKFYTGLLVCRGEWKREFLLGFLKAAGCYDALEGHIMRAQPNPECEISTDVLRHLYEEAIDEAVEAVENLYNCMTGEEKLSSRFNKNFG